MRRCPAAVAALIAVSFSLATASTAHAATPRCGGRAATLVGTPGNDVIEGTPGDDVIVGLTGADTIDGGGGDDLICGGSGRDVIDGGPGADHLYGGPAVDRLTGGSGDDHLAGAKGRQTEFRPGAGDDRMNAQRAYAVLDYSAAPGPVTVDLAVGTADGWGHDTIRLATGTGAEVIGSAFDDTLLGTSETDDLTGGGGTDTIDGRGGADTVKATEGDLVGGGGDDFISVSSASAPGTDIDGGAGDDSIDAPEDVAGLVAGAGDDVVKIDASGGVATHATTFSGGAGHDDFEVDLSTPGSPFAFDLTSGDLEIAGVTSSASGFEDFALTGRMPSFDVTGTDGANEISIDSRGAATPGTVQGLGGNDDIWGTAGDNTLLGGSGDDYLSGLGGDDLINGGTGTDSANGGSGTDTCTAVEDATDCESGGP